MISFYRMKCIKKSRNKEIKMSYNLKMENGKFVLTPVPKRQDFDLNLSIRNLNSQMSYLRSVVVATLNKIANLEVKIALIVDFT